MHENTLKFIRRKKNCADVCDSFQFQFEVNCMNFMNEDVDFGTSSVDNIRIS